MTIRYLVVTLLLCGALNATGAELGRFFFTPAQRDTLDAARAKNVRVEISNENPQPQAAAPVQQNVSVNGLVRRSDGANTVWVNSRPVTNRQSEGMGVTPSRAGSRVTLTAPEGRSIDLKVGQTAEIVSGNVEEGYARRKPPISAVKAAGPAPKTSVTSPAVAAEKAGEGSAQETGPIRERDAQTRTDGAPERP